MLTRRMWRLTTVVERLEFWWWAITESVTTRRVSEARSVEESSEDDDSADEDWSGESEASEVSRSEGITYDFEIVDSY